MVSSDHEEMVSSDHEGVMVSSDHEEVMVSFQMKDSQKECTKSKLHLKGLLFGFQVTKGLHVLPHH